MNERYEGDYRCDSSFGPDDPCLNIATKVMREPYTPGNFALSLCNECADGARAMGYHFDAEATEQLAKNVAREAERASCVALVPIRYCMECRQPTTGSIGQAGYYWPRLCQPCKDEADGVLRRQVKTQAMFARVVDRIVA